MDGAIIGGARARSIVLGVAALSTASVVSVAAAQELPVTLRIGDEVATPTDPTTPEPAPGQTPEPAPPPDSSGPLPPPTDEQPPPEQDRPGPPAAPSTGDDPDPAPDPDGAPLPRTGADHFRVLRDAAALMAAGLLLVRATRPTSSKEPR